MYDYKYKYKYKWKYESELVALRHIHLVHATAAPNDGPTDRPNDQVSGGAAVQGKWQTSSELPRDTRSLITE